VTDRAGPGGRPSDLSEERRVKRLRATTRAYIKGLRSGHLLATKDQRHTDQMFMWLLGLMGLGLFGLPTLLGTVCRAEALRPALVPLAAPWGVGILLALLGRLVEKAPDC
jgi:hypothetical protein